eukprot:TRINITY_DN3578_c0_g1_i1.p1 TRINITY_DN3578_c0_g1~~TRINITY_DN3578_c0_g1_i1.p1  ORF type:complete len:541 (+),score=194.05 TRINITY_DN3578_c0_g1_i1:94-1716(+)
MGDAIDHILVIGFHHQIGHVIEFAYPNLPMTQDGKFVAVPPEWNMIPYIALPDGAHLVEEDALYFNVPALRLENQITMSEETLYGVACFRQMNADLLLVKSEDIKRPMIQKAVVVLSRYPCYGLIEGKVKTMTQLYFEQRDFSQIEILIETYNILNNMLSDSYSALKPSNLHIGLSAKDLVAKLGRNTLSILKLLMLENSKIIFYTVSPVKEVSKAIFSLISLLPGSINQGGEFAGSEEEKDKLRRLGLPLELFHSKHQLIGYAPVNQFDIMKEKDGFLAGATNSLFFRNPPYEGTLALVNVSTGEVKIEGTNAKLATLSTRDANFIDEIVEVMRVSQIKFEGPGPDPNEATRLLGDGSEEWIRKRFDTYFQSFFCTAASIPEVFDDAIPEQLSSEGVADFNANWVKAWFESYSFSRWKRVVDCSIAEIPHEHPGPKGFLSGTLVEGFTALKVAGAQSLKDANLGAKMSTAAEAATTGAAVVSAKVSQFYAENAPGTKQYLGSKWSAFVSTVGQTATAAKESINERLAAANSPKNENDPK